MTARVTEGEEVTVVDLFAGIGGLSLGLERAGLTVVGQVEIDEWCRRVLVRHWPEVPRHDDVRTAGDWWHASARPRIDVVAGGFPCQPVSHAGRHLGTADPRWLWPDMAAFIAAVRPDWVLWENVPGLRTRGLHQVHTDLVHLGYHHRVGWATACALGAPHVRRRLFGLAHTHRLHGPPRLGPGVRRPIQAEHRTPHPPPHRRHWPLAPEPAVRRDPDGVPTRVDQHDEHAARRVTALGNAVVPAIAEHLGRLIHTTHRHGCRDLGGDHARATA